MPEDKDPAVETVTEKEVSKIEKVEKVDLESIAKQNKELNEKLEKVLKQNSDKDSHITRIQNENKELRDKIGSISTSLEGKTEKQKDAILERHREKFIESGYDEKSVDLILNAISDVADKKADAKISKVVTDAAMELIESDTDIDQDFVKNNEAEIMSEYNSYKLDEVSARKMKSNFKKAYKAVKDKLSEKAIKTRKSKDEEERDAMIDGNKPPQTSRKGSSHEDDFVKAIENSGSTNSHFM